jgi:hypothetical protein
MKISFTKNPRNPTAKNPTAVSLATFMNSFLSGFSQRLTNLRVRSDDVSQSGKDDSYDAHEFHAALRSHIRQTNLTLFFANSFRVTVASSMISFEKSISEDQKEQQGNFMI